MRSIAVVDRPAERCRAAADRFGGAAGEGVLSGGLLRAPRVDFFTSAIVNFSFQNRYSAV
jgi:hypothetical protein